MRDTSGAGRDLLIALTVVAAIGAGCNGGCDPGTRELAEPEPSRIDRLHGRGDRPRDRRDPEPRGAGMNPTPGVVRRWRGGAHRHGSGVRHRSCARDGRDMAVSDGGMDGPETGVSMPDWMPAAIVGLFSAGLFTWLLPTLKGLRGRAGKAETRLATLEALCLERDGRDPQMLRGYATEKHVRELLDRQANVCRWQPPPAGDKGASVRRGGVMVRRWGGFFLVVLFGLSVGVLIGFAMPVQAPVEQRLKSPSTGRRSARRGGAVCRSSTGGLMATTRRAVSRYQAGSTRIDSEPLSRTPSGVVAQDAPVAPVQEAPVAGGRPVEAPAEAPADRTGRGRRAVLEAVQDPAIDCDAIESDAAPATAVPEAVEEPAPEPTWMLTALMAAMLMLTMGSPWALAGGAGPGGARGGAGRGARGGAGRNRTGRWKRSRGSI